MATVTHLQTVAFKARLPLTSRPRRFKRIQSVQVVVIVNGVRRASKVWRTAGGGDPIVAAGRLAVLTADDLCF